MNVTVSVIMANYNHAAYLDEALSAIIAQTRPPDEIVVVDDGSTDNSWALLAEKQRYCSTLRILRNERNIGVVLSIARGVQAATGDYVYFAAADDRVSPDLLRESVDLLERYPQSRLCFSKAVYFGETKRNWVAKNLGNRALYLSPRDFAIAAAHPFFEMPTWTIVFRRLSFLEWGGLRPEFGWNCDWFIAYVLGFIGGACYVPKALAGLRISKASYGQNATRAPQMQSEILAKIMFELTDRRYEKIWEPMRRSGFLGHFPRAWQVAIRDSRFWTYLTPAFIRHAAVTELRLLFGQVFPDAFRAKMKILVFGNQP